MRVNVLDGATLNTIPAIGPLCDRRRACSGSASCTIIRARSPQVARVGGVNLFAKTSHAGSSNPSTPANSLAATLAARRVGETAPQFNWSITTSTISRIIERQSAQLAQNASCAMHRAPLCSHVSMWPSSRPFWPPSRVVFQNWGVGASRVRSGKRCRANLPRRGARVTVNMMVRDMDLPVTNARDARRLEIVADGLPLFGGVQLAVDTTLVPRRSEHRRGRPCSCPAQEGDDVSRVDWSQCPMSYGGSGETGGRWSEETRTFVGLFSWQRPKVEKCRGS